ncbi:2-methylcitrate dehydratase PrpD [Shimia gijangensis]|uniref:2-methylcitrate dehydratase PrpD n=1 Tax=Shimia gijangensis TaxID=1470563 RepID=A0A1M6L2X7_9RHOB|nr:MmgE/PrpD family protein [Shimia gijangensis]SHJ65512.1 2-methylcitrate dehydratase PrpD [Shimia gijangensis]
MTDALSFIHIMKWQNLPDAVKKQAELNVLDLIGVAAAGSQTPPSMMTRDLAHEEFGGTLPMLFDGRTSSATGGAMAAGITIDSIDGHDGFNPAKGHIGAPLFPAALMLGHSAGISGQAFLEAIVMGYEFGARASVAQHGTVPDYHTSGSWGAVTAAAAGSRIMGLDPETTRHALGIAEYHGPRSQMMRVIDYPSMLKDGAGWGAMCGTSAVKLAQKGFTGAPAITVENAAEYWDGLGSRWFTLEQYFKPYPVCRWAQAPIEGALALQRAHNIPHEQIATIEVHTFHESVRLAMKRPQEGDAAQYSTSFPVAVALVHGDVQPRHLVGDALHDPEVLRLSDAVDMRESDHANDNFPAQRPARVTLVLKDGTRHDGDWTEPRWDHNAPPTEAEFREKFHSLADPVLGKSHADAIETALAQLQNTPLSALSDQLLRPIRS